MANKSNFSVEEWDLLRKVPFLTGMIVVAASPSGPIGLVQESAAASTMIREALEKAHTELMRVLAEDLKENLHVPRLEAETPDSIRQKGLAACRDVATLLSTKASPEEAEEFKSWLIELATKVAEAATEGGFLGFGGTLVTTEESSAIDQIQVALR